MPVGSFLLGWEPRALWLLQTEASAPSNEGDKVRQMGSSSAWPGFPESLRVALGAAAAAVRMRLCKTRDPKLVPRANLPGP